MTVHSLTPNYVDSNEKNLIFTVDGADLENISQIKLNDTIDLSFQIISTNTAIISQKLSDNSNLNIGKNFIKFISVDSSEIVKFITAFSRPRIEAIKLFSKSETFSAITRKTSLSLASNKPYEIEIEGKNLEYVDEITVGDIEITSFSVISSENVKFEIPAFLPNGIHKIRVSSLGVKSTENINLNIFPLKPAIKTIFNNIKHSQIPKTIEITGDGLNDPSLEIFVNNIPVETIERISNTQVKFPFLIQEIGKYPLSIKNNSGETTYESILEVIRTPIINSVSPNQIGVPGVTQVEVSGENLDLIETVTSIFDVNIDILTKSSNTLTLELETAEETPDGFFDLTFHTVYDSFKFSNAVQIIGEIVIDSIYPSFTQAGIDPSVTIEGQNFIPGQTRVFLGETEAISVEVQSDGTKALVIFPSGATGFYDVEIDTSLDSKTLPAGFEFSGTAVGGASSLNINSVPIPGASIFPLSIDSNQDNVPNSWDKIYFGESAVGTIDHRQVDSNANGHTNFQEYVFGTNPATSHNPYNATLSLNYPIYSLFFQTYNLRKYTIQYKTSLVSQTWLDYETITGDGTFKRVDIDISSYGQFFTRLNVEKYEAEPYINSVFPYEISATGGQLVISGDNFSSTSGLYINNSGVSSDRIFVANDNRIEVSVPPIPNVGEADLTVSTHGGTSSLSNAFYITSPNPTLDLVIPNIAAAGLDINQAAYLSGQNLDTVTTVVFGTSVATILNKLNKNLLEVSVPKSNFARSVNITLRNTQNQSFVFNNAFSYINIPSVSSVTPAYAPALTQSNIAISGDNLATVEKIDIYGANVLPIDLNFTYQSPQQINCEIPNTLTDGTYYIRLYSYIGDIERVATIQFNILKSLTISFVDPLLIPSKMNAQIEISGAGFTPNGAASSSALTAKINNQTMTLVSISENKIIAQTPSLDPGDYNVQIYNGVETKTSAETIKCIEFSPNYTMPTTNLESRSRFITSNVNTIYATHQ
jgi:hypothetical protein